MILAVVMAVVAAAGETEPLEVAVGPVLTAEGEVEAAMTDRLVGFLRRVDRLVVRDLRGVLASEGPRATAAWRRCRDDACRLERLSGLRFGRLLLTELDRTEGVLRMRLLTEEGRVEVRVARTLSDDAEADLRSAAVDVFPVRAATSLARLVIEGLPDGAAVRFDDDPPQVASGPRLSARLAPGPHAVEVRAPAHAPWRSELALSPGERRVVDAELSLRRSSGPLWLGGAGLVALGAGAALAGAAQLRVDDWRGACADAGCAPGFTRARYRSDRDALDREQTAAALTLSIGGAALVAALVWYALDPGRAEPGDLFVGPSGAGVRFP
mgnify:CR=1 FL=1